MRKYFNIIVALSMCLLLFSGCAGLFASNKMANLKSVYGLGSGEAAIIMDGELVEDVGKVIDGVFYLPESFLRAYAGKGFYWNGKDNYFLYTNAKKVNKISLKKSENGLVEDDELLISKECVEKYMDLEMTVYQDPDRVVINTNGTQKRMVPVSSNTEVRAKGGYKSDILTKVSKGDTVRLLEAYETWGKVCTEDGQLGYMELKKLKQNQEVIEVVDTGNKNPDYERLTVDGPICLAWQDMESNYGNVLYDSLIANTDGVTVYSPAWIALNDNEGNFKSLCNANIVQDAHSRGMQVWVLADDFSDNMSIGKVLGNTKMRQKLVDKLVDEVLSVGADGINVDFEYITDSCGKSFIQFLRELKLRCTKENLILSVDNANPTFVKYCYDMAEQGKIADYVVLMGYDEHWQGSEAGSVSSIDFVRGGIDAALTMVPSNRIISGLPFYCRAWTEIPEEYAAEGAAIREDGYSDYERYSLDSEALSMDQVEALVKNAGVTPEWSESYGQYYVEIPLEHGVQKIWIEDMKSLEEKLKVVSGYKLAGVAFWRMGMEKTEAWDLIQEYMN